MRWIKVTGIPATLQTIRELFLNKWEVDEPGAVGKNKWKMELDDMETLHNVKFVEMRDTGWTTITWTQCKTFLFKEDDTLVEDADLG